ncbi:MAG: BtrH N-terminal domain-containing protein [Coprobacillaceae bacterium]
MIKKVNDFIPQGGKHCITTALKQVFDYHGYPLSEAMMLGLSSGIAFTYINMEHSPMVAGRSKIGEFEEKLSQRLHIKIQCKSGKNNERISIATKKMINENKPVLIYVDMPYLSYLGLGKNNHFGGHAVVLFGYDDEKEEYYISDRDHSNFPIRTPKGEIHEDYHLVSYKEVEKARSSSFRPFPANNKYLVIDFEGYQQITPKVIYEAIYDTCQTMLYPPANLLGINGIMKFSREILKWKNFSTSKLKIAGTTNYFQINGDGGTGGGIFRNMYGIFLKEAANIVSNSKFDELGERFIEISKEWDVIANDLWDLSITANVELLTIISNKIIDICNQEKELYQLLLQEIEV